MQGKNGSKLDKSSRKPALRQKYVSPNQLTIPGFETPFEQQLTQSNRWVRLSKLIPWDAIVSKYNSQFKSKEGRPPINGRIVLGSVIIKQMLDLTDDETIEQLRENMFMQYFIGYSSFTNEAPFDSSLFVDIRKRLSSEFMEEINRLVLSHNAILPKQVPISKNDINDNDLESKNAEIPEVELCTSLKLDDKEEVCTLSKEESVPHQGKLLIDASVCPQAITYPTDLKLIDASRMKSEKLLDKLYSKAKSFGDKPRTYRRVARKDYLSTAMKKNKSNKELRSAIASQLRYLKRNLESIEKLITYCKQNSIVHKLKPKDMKYLETIQIIYSQQNTMYETNTRTIENRIVNIHQPHVRPMVRGKAGKKVEFGSKIHLAMFSGFAFLDKLSWDSFNEGAYLRDSVEKYKQRFGFYPKEVLADKIYCTRENRKYLKGLKIKLLGKPLGRPTRKEAVEDHVSPVERNPIEGKFGQAKVGYGLERVRAKLQETSESWISSTLMVLNLIKLMRLKTSCLYHNIMYYLVNLNFPKLTPVQV